MHLAYINPSSLGPALIIPYQSSLLPSYLATKEVNGSEIICRNGKWSSVMICILFADPCFIGCWSDGHVYNGKGFIKGVGGLEGGD